MRKLYPFNVRVYGLLIQDKQVLVADEFEYGLEFTKFPGGGLEYGEGTIDCLKREFREECNMDIEIIGHFYTTDFFQESLFNDSQVISIYYKVRNLHDFPFTIKEQAFDFDEKKEGAISFRWLKLQESALEEIKLPIDQEVVKKLLASFNK